MKGVAMKREHSDLWVTFAAAALVTAHDTDCRSRTDAAARVADEMLDEWKSRFEPEETDQ